jgi:SAM-dependent methyltransferase
MKFKISQLLIRLKKILPRPLKSVLRVLGLGRLQSLLRNISTFELEYQKSLVEAVKNNQSELLEYWRKYRYLDDIKAICNIGCDTKVIDVGCGISTVLHFVEGERYGIDPLAREYRQLYAFPKGIDIRRGHGEKIPFPDGYFDIVFSSSALDHTVNPSKTITEIQRVLKSRGYFVLCVDVFAENEVSRYSRHSLEKKDIYSLIADEFRTVFERDAPRIPIKAYINGSRESCSQELIMVSEKM